MPNSEYFIGKTVHGGKRKSPFSGDTFVMEMTSLSRALSLKGVRDSNGNAINAGVSRRSQSGKTSITVKSAVTALVQREMTTWGENVLVPTMQAFAPSRGVDLTHNSLKSTIKLASMRGGKNTSMAELRLQMGWWGRMTQEMHSQEMDAGEGHAFKIVLPGGGVIFRRKINGATRRAFSSAAAGPEHAAGNSKGSPYYEQPANEAPPLAAGAAKDRMDWMRDAYRAVRFGSQSIKTQTRGGDGGESFTVNEDLEALLGNIAAAIISDPAVSAIFEDGNIDVMTNQAYKHSELGGRLVGEVNERLGSTPAVAKARKAYKAHIQKRLGARKMREQNRISKHRDKVNAELDRAEKQRNKAAVRERARREREEAHQIRQAKRLARQKVRSEQSLNELYTNYKTLKEAYWGHVSQWNMYDIKGRPARANKAWRRKEQRYRAGLRHVTAKLKARLPTY